MTKKTLITTFTTDVSHLSAREIETAQALYLAGLPPELRHTVTFDVQADAPPSYSERMLSCVRAEFARYDNRCVYRPRRYTHPPATREEQW